MQLTIDYKKGHRRGRRQSLLTQFKCVGFNVIQTHADYDDLQGETKIDQHAALVGLLLINSEVAGFSIDKEN